jgi:ribonucleotide reductase alpha subunit
MNDIKTLLDEELKVEIENLSVMENGSEAKASAVDDISKLYRLKIEELKLEQEREQIANEQAKLEQEKARLDYERSKLDREIHEQKNDRIWKTALDGITTAATLIFYGVWMRKGLKFEETGTYTSSTFKGLFSRFKPTKK